MNVRRALAVIVSICILYVCMYVFYMYSPSIKNYTEVFHVVYEWNLPRPFNVR
jgi:hypothetical protein